MRILVIDDDPAVRHATQLLLECEGFEVIVAQDGRSGLAATRSKSFAAVIVDIFMPEMDGLETIKALRANDPNLRIIAISGALGPSGTPDFLAMATKLWGVKTLNKPFRPRDLIRTIGEAIADAPEHSAAHEQNQERDVPRRGATA
jgi:two-component system, response regulator, stage 0 sporulation protein F